MYFVTFKEEAKRARRKMYLNDKYGDRRKRIGDSKLEISILIRKKKKPIP